MSEDKTKWVSLKVRQETKDRINALTQYGSQDTIVNYLLDQNDKHNLFNPGWARKIAEEQLQDILSDMDLDFRKKVEFANHKARLKAVDRVFMEYIKILEPKEKKDWLENILGNTKSQNFLENMTSYQMFIIDGQKRLLLPDEDGFPRIPGIKKDRIQTCERGYHIRDSKCDCRFWKECPTGENQYVDWLGKYGTEFQKRQYLESQNPDDRFIRRREYL